MHPVVLLVALALTVSSAAPAPILGQLHAPADSELEMRVLADGFVVGVWARNVSPAALRAVLPTLTGADVNLDLLALEKSAHDEKDSSGDSIAYVHFAEPVHQVSVSWKSGLWHLVIVPEDRMARLKQHLLALKLPLPGGVDGHDMRRADLALAAGHMAEAKAAYTELRDVYAMAAWATLRLGDVSLLEGDNDGACALWNSVDAVSPGRVAGTMGQLRSRALRCPDAAMPDWVALLLRQRRDDVVGRYLREQTRWALQWESDGAALESALSTGQAALTTPLQHALWARLLRTQPPEQVARLAQIFGLGDERHHPEAFDLALTVGRALCRLDLQPWAKAQMDQAPTQHWLKLDHNMRAAWKKRVSTCALASETVDEAAARARAQAQAPSPLAATQATLASIQTRLDAVAASLTRELAVAPDD